jgi:urocanate hydratase
MVSNTIKEIDASELAQWIKDADHNLRVTGQPDLICFRFGRSFQE